MIFLHEGFYHLHVNELHQVDFHLRPSGVPAKPEIDGPTKPAIEGDHITLTCMTQGSKPAADLRWFRNEKEVKGESQQTKTKKPDKMLQVSTSRFFLMEKIWTVSPGPDCGTTHSLLSGRGFKKKKSRITPTR